MLSLFKSTLIALALVPLTSYGQVKYDAALSEKSQSNWSVLNSKISCVLSYAIEGFGRGDFVVLSGSKKKHSFELFMQTPLNQASQMRFISAPSDWTPVGDEKLIGRIKIYKGFNPFVGDSVSLRMLTALEKGRQILMPYTNDKTLPNETIVPTISPIGFNEKYNEFLLCTSNLMDISYKDIELLAITFDDASDMLTAPSVTRLLDQIEYIKNDSSVNRISITVFSYGLIDNLENKDLADRRVASLKKYFADAGIKEDIIEVKTLYNNRLSPNTNSTTADIDSRKALIELDRDRYKIKYDYDVDMPDIGAQLK